MPQGLYFTAVICLSFYLSFFRRLISEVTERSSTKLGHIFTYDWYLKNLVQTPLSIYSHGWGLGKNRFWHLLWTLTKHISAKEADINNQKETCQSKETALHAPTFGDLWSRNGWEWLASFCPPLNFRIVRHCQPYRMDVILQTAGKLWHVLCSGTSLQSRTTECRVGSRWALPCI